MLPTSQYTATGVKIFICSVGNELLVHLHFNSQEREGEIPPLRQYITRFMSGYNNHPDTLEQSIDILNIHSLDICTEETETEANVHVRSK